MSFRAPRDLLGLRRLPARRPSPARGEEEMMMNAVLERPERLATAIGGAALVVWGANKLSRERHPLGALMATTGAGLIWRSTRGDTRARLAGSRGVNVEESFSINRPPQELYRVLAQPREPAARSCSSSSSVARDRSRGARTGWRRARPACRSNGTPRSSTRFPNELIAWRTLRGLRRGQRRLGALRAAPAGPRHRRARASCSTTRRPARSAPRVAWLFGDEPSQRRSAKTCAASSS